MKFEPESRKQDTGQEIWQTGRCGKFNSID